MAASISKNVIDLTSDADEANPYKASGELLEYLKPRLLHALVSIEAEGSFASFGRLDYIDPEIHVPLTGTLAVPLQQNQAQLLMKACHQAPFGKGDQTIVDLAVRNTLELNADEFEIQSSEWQQLISTAIERATKELGICGGNDSVRAELYKMLLYGPGSHFHKHKE
jgi:hypothetical protein